MEKSIYCLVDSDGQWRYIGASVDPRSRHRSHEGARRQYALLILEEPSSDWSLLERAWIREAWEAGEPIENIKSNPGATPTPSFPQPWQRPVRFIDGKPWLHQVYEMCRRLRLAEIHGWRTEGDLRSRLDEISLDWYDVPRQVLGKHGADFWTTSPAR